MFLGENGSLWLMGSKTDEPSNDGTHSFINHPEQIVASGVINIAAGLSHCLFVKSDGSLWAMGENNYGQLGYETRKTEIAQKTFEPTQVVCQPLSRKSLARD